MACRRTPGGRGFTSSLFKSSSVICPACTHTKPQQPHEERSFHRGQHFTELFDAAGCNTQESAELWRSEQQMRACGERGWWQRTCLKSQGHLRGTDQPVTASPWRMPLCIVMQRSQSSHDVTGSGILQGQGLTGSRSCRRPRRHSSQRSATRGLNHSRTQVWLLLPRQTSRPVGTHCPSTGSRCCWAAAT